jgi:transposase
LVVDLTEKQWAAIKRFVPGPERKGTSEQGGRPWRDPRDVLNGILWVLRTGAPWADMPRRYPPYQTCHRRFQKWEKERVLDRILRALAEHLRDVGKVDLTEAYIDGSHAGAKRGALLLDELDAARRPRSWQWQTAMAFLSPSGLRVVSDMKHHSSSRLSEPDS